MHTLDQHLADLVNTGQITYVAAVEKVHDAAGFDRLINRMDGSGVSVQQHEFATDFGAR